MNERADFVLFISIALVISALNLLAIVGIIVLAVKLFVRLVS